MAALASRRSTRALGWVLLAVFSALGVLLASTAQAAVDPGADVAAQELQTFTDLLDDVAASPLLTTPIPLTSKTPSSALDLPARLAAIKAALAGLDEFTEIADALEAQSGTFGGITVAISGPDTTSATDQILFQPSGMDPNLQDLVFEIKVRAASASLPISLSSSLLNLAGGSLSADVTLQSSVLQFQLDKTKATSPDANVRATALSLRTVPDASAVAPASPTAPVFKLTAAANGAISSFAGALGFGGVNVTGNGAIDVRIDATVQDPGDPDGHLRADEWSSLPLATAVNVAVVNTPTDAVNATLTLAPSPAIPKPGGGNVGNATVTFVDADIDGTAPVVTPTFGELEGFVNISSKDALAGLEALATSLLNVQNAGRLGLNLPFLDKRLDEVVAIQEKLATAVAALKKAPDNAADQTIKTLPTFATIQELQTKLAAAPGALAIVPKYDPTSKRLSFGISYSDSRSLTTGLGLNLGNLGIISEIVNAVDPTIRLVGRATLGFTFGFDLAPLPQENNAGPLSCEDGLDNGGANAGIDAGDPDCASLKTMDQRAFLDVGTNPAAAPLVALAGSARAQLSSASARVGLLTAQVTNAEVAVGPAGGENGAGAGTCFDGIDNGGEGNGDGADPDCTMFELRIHEEGPDADGIVTLEQLIQTIGSPVPSPVKVATKVNATVAGKVPVSASLGTFSVGPKEIKLGVTGGSLTGDLTNPSALLDALQLDTTAIDTSDLLSFSPCGNGKDDDGDGTVDDGCPGGAPANDKPEVLSTALFDKILTLLDLLKGSIDSAESETAAGLALDEPIPLIGKSVKDILGTGGIVDRIKTVLTNKGEAGIAGDSCTNGADDDFDGFTNDGCPSSGTPEGGISADNGNQCAGTTDDDGDGVTNDGCAPAIASLQSLANQLKSLVEKAFDDAAAGATGVSKTVTAAIDYAPASDSLTFSITPTFNITRGTTFNLDLSSLIPGMNLASIVDGAAAGNVTAALVAKPTLAFGIELDTLRPFLLGSTGLDVTATASATDLRFDAGIGPIKVSVGKDADLGSIALGFKGSVDLAGGATDHRYFDGGPGDGIDFTATFDGTQPSSCDTVNGNAKNDACAVLPLYIGGNPVGAAPGHKITASMEDITGGFGGSNFELVFPNSGDLGSAIAGNVLDLLLVNSGLQRLLDTFNALLSGQLFGFDFPIIGDALEKVANMTKGLTGPNGLQAIVTGAIGGTNPLDGKIFAKDVEDFVDGTLNSPTTGIGKLLLDAGILLEPGKNPITDPSAPAEDVSSFKVTVQCGPEGNKQCDTGGEDDIATNGSLADTSATTDAAANCANDTSQDDDNGDGVIDSSDRVNDGCPAVADKESGADCGNRLDDDGDGTVDDGCPNPQPAGANDGDDGDPEPTTPDETACLDGLDNDDDGTIDDGCAAFDPGPPVGGPDDGETPAECNNNDDDDGDGVKNDGCDAVLAPAGAVGQIRFDANIGQAAQANTGGLTAGFGIPGLNLQVKNGGVFASAGWQVQMGFGISKKLGFFVATDNDPEIRLGANVSLSDPAAGSPAATLDATLGFLKVEIMDGDPANACDGNGTGHCLGAGDVVDPRSGFSPQFTVDLTDPGSPVDGRLTFNDLSQGFGFSDLFEFDFSGEARINASIQVKVDSDSAAFPRVMGDLHLLWKFGLADQSDPSALGCGAGCASNAGGSTNSLSVSLDSMSLDAGAFLNKFLGPIVGDIKKYTEPLKPVLDTLNYPLPVLSDFAGKPVTLLTLCELFPSQIFDTRFIVNVAKFLTFVQSLPTLESGNPTIPLGDGNFSLNAATLQQGALPDSQALQAFAANELESLKTAVGSLIDELDNKMADGGGDVKNLAALTGEDSSDGIGITFPFLQDPSKLMGLLFKQDVVLIHWEVPDLSIGFSYSQKFGPIWYVPPVFLQINGSASITGHLGIGYDTEGLRKVLFDGDSADALLEGLFLDDKKFQTNTDVPEIEVKGRLAAGAEVSVLIFSAGAEGGINLNLALDLKDPNNDGILKYGEVVNIVKSTGNPFCIFIFSGKLSVDISVYAEVDLFFWSERWSKTLADITIFEFKVECKDQPAPKLAKEISAGVLQLNIGPKTGYRDTPENPGREEGVAGKSQGSTEINEKVTVRVLDASSIEVTGLGVSQVYKTAHPGGWDKVVGDGGKGTDSITMLQGGDPAELGEDCGNGTDDTDPANGIVNDGCPTAGAAPETVCTGNADEDGDGKINDGCPVRVVGWPSDFTAELKGGADADAITGTERGDTLEGGAGDDVITAGEGDNTVVGNDGNDRLQGGTGKDKMYGDSGPSNPDDPAQTGNDQINADLGDDLVYGGPGDDNLVGGISTINTQAAPKIGASIPGQTDGIDEVHGGPGKDTIDGGDGDDKLFGDADADNIQGTGGNDDIRGGDEGAGGCGTAGDTLVGGPGDDDIEGGAGDDLVIGGSMIALTADTGDTNLDGDGGCDVIVGDNAAFGNPPVRTQPTLIDPTIGGADTINGGDDGDLIWGQKDGDTITGGAGGDTIRGNDGADDIDAGSGNDVAYGDAHDDTVIGGDGGDTIEGNDGFDVILGDEGTVTRGSDPANRDDDTRSLGGGSGVDKIKGGEQRDLIYGQADGDTINGDGGDDLALGGGGNDTIRGGLDNDELFGNDGVDTIFGEAGKDRIVGGSDDATTSDDGDLLYGGSGDDAMLGDNGKLASVDPGGETLKAESTIGGADAMFGEDGSDRMFGEKAGDTMSGGPLDDYMEGNGGDDAMKGEGGQDDMIGGGDAAGVPDDGETSVSGGLNIDYIAGDNASITRPGGTSLADGSANRIVDLRDLDSSDAAVSGDDKIWGDESRDIIFGGGENDTIEGDSASAVATGGDDHVEGNGGADTIKGQAAQDDLIGGTTQGGGNHPDGVDAIYGGDGTAAGIASNDFDYIAGDNAAILRPTQGDGTWFLDDLSAARSTLDIVRRRVQLFDVATTTVTPASGTGAGDVLFGGAQFDTIYGQAGNDQLTGQGGDDYLEGNAGDDLAWGNGGQDDLVGGTGRTDTGLASVEDGRLDGADQLFGGDGNPTETVTSDDYDTIVGDNATVLRSVVLGDPWTQISPNGVDAVVSRTLTFYDVGTKSAPAGDGTAGGDILRGEANDDTMYGQGADDDMKGGTGDDYMEGNAGKDTMFGEADDDDMLGGTGLINGEVIGDTGLLPASAAGRLDAGETRMEGGDGFDVMSGDNAVIRRVLVDGTWQPNTYNGGTQHERIYLIDINDTSSLVAGGDLVLGNADDDVLYGQAGDDTIKGATGQDHIEGNAGGDQLYGNEDQDDMVGGTGRVNDDPATGTNGRLDGDDHMRGEDDETDGANVAQGGGDVMLGDNGIISRPLTGGLWIYERPNNKVKRDVVLVDVEDVGSNVATDVHGNDFMYGNGDDDSMWGQGGDDAMFGGAGDDTMEGNHATDTMHGGPDQDDMFGGSTVANRLDEGDLLYGEGGSDFQLGDNGTLTRKLVGPAATADWLRYVEVGAPMDPNDIVREAIRFDVAGDATTYGSDYIQGDAGDDHQWGQDGNDVMHGNTDNDDMFGELGNDRMFGEEGEDAMVGDRGGIVDRLVDGSTGDPTSFTISVTAPPAIRFTAWRDHPLDRRVDLLHDQNADGTGFLAGTLDKNGRDFGGDDYMRGGPDHDSMHGAFGADVMNGDSGGDILFGDDGADAIWGGKGCDPAAGDVCPDGLFSRGTAKNADGSYVDDFYVDYTFGGFGAPGAGSTVPGSDFLDYRPRAGIDPAIWFEATNTRPADPVDAHQHHQGIDWIYGGWDRDVLQADQADNGPNPGDRLLDWGGAYNLYTHCNSAYGGFNDVREISPNHQSFLQQLAYALGAGPTLANMTETGTSGFRELALVYTQDLKKNTGKAYPNTPGHFNDFSCAP